jgi:hypothetical protein
VIIILIYLQVFFFVFKIIRVNFVKFDLFPLYATESGVVEQRELNFTKLILIYPKLLPLLSSYCMFKLINIIIVIFKIINTEIPMIRNN